MAGPTHHIYLIPGFFGFAQFGNVKYFAHVRDLLEPAFEGGGVGVAVHYVPTLPTASLQRRAGRLLETILATAEEEGPIHLIGHSSGGLDARLLTTPGSPLLTSPEAEAALARVESVVGIATPHRGTPLAAFFNTLAGRRVLRLLSLASLVVLRRGKLPLGAARRMLGVIRKVESPRGIEKTVLDQLFEQLLTDFSPERRQELRRFLLEAYRDQDLLAQLTPQAMATINAQTPANPAVRYGDVVLRARAPGMLDIIELGFDTYAQVLHRIYKWLHKLASGGRRPTDTPLALSVVQSLSEVFGDPPPPSANDGIVPTRSQVMGQVIHASWADHLDAIGHFDDRRHEPPHHDWLPSASRFRRRHFEALWGDVLDFIAPDQTILHATEAREEPRLPA